MQAIVADTTPLNYLVLLQAVDILTNLYRTVLIPPAVKAELAHANSSYRARVVFFTHASRARIYHHIQPGEKEAFFLRGGLPVVLKEGLRRRGNP